MSLVFLQEERTIWENFSSRLNMTGTRPIAVPCLALLPNSTGGILLLTSRGWMLNVGDAGYTDTGLREGRLVVGSTLLV